MFTIKYINRGNVIENELETIEQLLPVMAHIQENKYPYYVMNDDTVIFKHNLQYLPEHKKPAVSFTLRIKNHDTTEVHDFSDIVALSAATVIAMESKLPWYIIDNSTGKMIRKGNLDQLGKSTKVAAANEDDVQSMIDDVNSALADIDLAV